MIVIVKQELLRRDSMGFGRVSFGALTKVAAHCNINNIIVSTAILLQICMKYNIPLPADDRFTSGQW